MTMPKTSPTRRRAADPFALLQADHRAVEALFARLDSARPGRPRLDLFLEIKEALGRHAVLEERIAYPALRSTPDPMAQGAATKGYDDHDDIKGLLAEIETMSPTADAFPTRCLALRDCVAQHVEAEEGEMFPLGRRVLGERRLSDLTRRLESARAEQDRAGAPTPRRARKT